MIFGHRNVFAIELSISPSVDNGYQFVSGSWWILDNQLGNASEVTLFPLFVSAMEDLLERLSKQCASDAESIFCDDAGVIFNYLDEKLWVGEHQDSKLTNEISNPINFYSLPIGVEIFDGEKAYLIHGARDDRVVWREWGRGVGSGLIPKNIYRDTVSQAVYALKNITTG